MYIFTPLTYPNLQHCWRCTTRNWFSEGLVAPAAGSDEGRAFSCEPVQGQPQLQTAPQPRSRFSLDGLHPVWPMWGRVKACLPERNSGQPSEIQRNLWGEPMCLWPCIALNFLFSALLSPSLPFCGCEPKRPLHCWNLSHSLLPEETNLRCSLLQMLLLWLLWVYLVFLPLQSISASFQASTLLSVFSK